MKLYLVGGLLLAGNMITLYGSAQRVVVTTPVHSRQLSITNDNDFYLAQYRDRYYTNGLYINYSWAAKSIHRRIHTLELGQQMYNPYTYRSYSQNVIDRPYAGFLYLAYRQTRFYANDQLFRWSVTGGITGKPSLAEALQKSYHRLVGFKAPLGWGYQVKTEPGLGAEALYATTLFPGQAHTGIAAIKPVAELSAGSSLTRIRGGILFQLGAFEKNGASNLWNAGISRDSLERRRSYECFLYFYPQLAGLLYNATIQGGLFRRDKGITREPERLLYQHTLGFMYAANRWLLGVSVVYQTKETLSQRFDQRYGSVQIGYRFK